MQHQVLVHFKVCHLKPVQHNYTELHLKNILVGPYILRKANSFSLAFQAFLVELT